jgi:hypothetical protein
VALERGFAPAVWALLVGVALTGCAIVDQYSGRAVGYNLEAEQALDQGLLLNVVRASLRRPMQFTSVQSISGTASISSTATFTVPFVPGAGSSAFAPSISGGPTFAVPVLDTKEFYQGVMTPISSQLLDFFIHEEFPREELFTLFVEKIVIHRNACRPEIHTDNCELVFVNYPGNDLQFDLTQSLIEYLLNLGITTELLRSGGKSESSSKSTDSGSDSDNHDQNSEAAYRFCFAPHDPVYAAQIKERSELCQFVKHEKSEPKRTLTWTEKHMTTDQHGTVIHEQDKTVAQAPDGDDGGDSASQEIKKRTSVSGFVFSDSFIGNLKMIAGTHASKSEFDNEDRDYSALVRNIDVFRAGKVPVGGPYDKLTLKDNIVTVAIYSRSTEGILYFLGEVIRRKLHPDQMLYPEQQPRTIQVKIETTPYRHFSELPCPPQETEQDQPHRPQTYSCQNLFVLDENPGLQNSGIGRISYDGMTYGVPGDPHAAGKTLHVLSIAKQLLAVNTSAKSLPQTNILGVVSQ